MAHDTVRNGPCALRDGHKNRHRTVKNYESYLVAKRRYHHTGAGVRNSALWRARHPVEDALSAIRGAAKRRGGQ